MKTAWWVAGLLAIVVVPAHAEWSYIGSADGVGYYFDPTTVKKKGDRRTAWVMVDLGEEQRVGEVAQRSTKTLVEYDCLNETFRQTYHVAYSGPLGAGKPVWTGDFDESPRPVVPDSVAAGYLEAVCSLTTDKRQPDRSS